VITNRQGHIQRGVLRSFGKFFNLLGFLKISGYALAYRKILALPELLEEFQNFYFKKP